MPELQRRMLEYAERRADRLAALLEEANEKLLRASVPPQVSELARLISNARQAGGNVNDEARAVWELWRYRLQCLRSRDPA